MTLVVKNITKSYGDIDVLRDVSFELRKGDLVGIIGPNGAGKTTTFKVLCGLIDKDGGEITYSGEEIAPSDMSWKKKIGYLAEHNPLYPEMYVQEFLFHIASLSGLKNPKKRIAEVIKQVGLQDHYKRRISVLSKGYKQRLGLAQAILHNPDILILDEPTSGLDPGQLIEIRSLIRELSKWRIILLSSHILHEIAEICSRIVMIENGRIALDRSMSHNSGMKMRLLFDTEVRTDWFSHIGNVESVNNDSKQIIISLKNAELRGALFDIAVTNQVKILEMTPVESDLEREFLQLLV